MLVYAGFDLGGTQLKFGLTDGAGKVIFQQDAGTPETRADLLVLLKSTWHELKKREGLTIASAGLGFPGVFNLQEQKILQSPNYPEIDGFELRPALSEFIDVPFTINNDANMAAFGEFSCGAGKGASSLVLLTIGTGIGSGLILDGRLWQGACGYAGELGHAVVNPDGDGCHCGSSGCLETEVSAPKIVKNYRMITGEEKALTAEDIFQRAKRGERPAVEAFALCGYYLGIGLSLAINLLNPEKILLGGGVINAEEFLLRPALDEARKRSFRNSFDCCQIQKANLGNRAGFIGAAMWAKILYGL